MKISHSMATMIFTSLAAHVDLIEKSVVYSQNGAELGGFDVFDDSISGKRPGVLVIHQWTGLIFK